MQFNNFSKYFISGFSLAKRNLNIFLIIVCFDLLFLLFSHSRDYGISSAFALLFFPLIFINKAFNLSLPVFLEVKQGEKTDYKGLISTTLKNTKRIILPGLLILFIGMALLLTGVVILHQTAPLDPPKMQEYTKYVQQWWRILGAIFSTSFLVFEFTAFYFSLENKGLFKSLGSSISTVFKNLHFMLYFAVVNLIMHAYTALIPQNLTIGLIAVILNLFISFILTCTALIYYRQVIKKD